MIPQQPAAPRESALGLQFSAVLSRVCWAVGQVAILYAGSESTLSGLMGPLFTLFLIISYVVGTVWVRRCWSNAELLTPGGQPYGRGWTTVGWLVPVLNIWMLWRILLGLWRASGVAGAPSLVHVWWGTHLASVGAALLSYVPGLHSAGRLVAAVVGVVSAGLFAVVVRRITGRQHEALAAARAADAPQGEDGGDRVAATR